MLIGIGSRFRRDDAAGLEVARRIREAQPPGVRVIEDEGEPTSLLHLWTGAEEAIVVDSVDSGSAPGALHRFEVADGPLPAKLFAPSSHAFGVAEAVALARELDRLPGRLAVYAIEGEDFGVGEGLSPAVEAAVSELVDGLHRELGG